MLELIATSTFGLEAVVKREVEALGFKILKTENGKVTYEADERGIVVSNLHLRCADRVLLKLAEFPATKSEELFQGIKAIKWEKWIKKDGFFHVECSTVKSQLASERKTQSVGEKALITRLSAHYGCEEFTKSGEHYPVKISILKDMVTVTLDTSGDPLHKRGYRQSAIAAPLKETMAAALVSLSFWKEGRKLVDPCCGSGTIAIEAAMMGMNIAPGLGRAFLSEKWDVIPKEMWKEERKKAFEAIKDANFEICGYDVEKKHVDAALSNADEAGVGEDISFETLNIKDLKLKGKGGILISNPPYGERIGEKEQIKEIYDALRRLYKENPTWSFYIISSDKSIEKKVFGRPADRRRKLYNGNIEVCYYQYHGEKPNDRI